MAKLKVMCARSMHQVVGALTEAFRQATGHEIELSFGTVGALQKRLDTGETGRRCGAFVVAHHAPSLPVLVLLPRVPRAGAPSG